MHGNGKTVKKIVMWSLVIVYTAIVYLTLPYGPIIREKIYKSFPPKILETYPLKYKSFQVKEKEGVLYSAEGKHGLGIYDISKPGTLNELGRVAAKDSISGFYESRNILYLVDGHAGINIIDVHRPAQPKELSRFTMEEAFYDVVISDQYMLIAGGQAGLIIVDASEKERPALISQLSLPGVCTRVSADGNLAFVGTDSAGLYIVNFGEVSKPYIVTSVKLPGVVTSILVEENFAYIACLNKGIQVIDIAKALTPKSLGFFPNSSRIPQMRYRNGYLMAADEEKGLLLINVNNPKKPALHRIFKTAGKMTYVYHRYYFAYLADDSPRAYYVDIDSGRNFVVYFVGALLVIVLLSIIIYLIKTHQSHNIFNYVALVVVAVIYGYYLYGMLAIPIEAIHFLEYGFLGVLVFLALKNHINNVLIFFIGASLITLIGTGDEFLQWILPNRSWDFRDIGFNALSGGLVQLAIWLGLSLQSVKGKVTLRSMQVLRRFLIAVALVFAVLLSMTPQLNTKIASTVLFLKFLDNPTPITEYGYKVFHPDVGGFFSRFEKDKLMRYDQQHGKEVAAILNNHYRTNYKEFLNKYTPGNAPFVHEMRVHAFRRDRYFHDRRLWVAYKENLILEHFFTNSLEGSLYKWRGEEMQLCREQLGEQIHDFYVSPVSENIITSYNVRTVWRCFFVFSMLIFIVEYFIKRRGIFK